MSDPRITDQAVEKAARAIYAFPTGCRLEPWAAVTGTLRREYLRAGRAALEAALPHLAPQPLTSREPEGGADGQLQRWYSAMDADEADDAPWPSGLSADNPLLTFTPQPTRDQIAEALHAHDQKRALVPRTWAKASELTKHTYLSYADAVLALLNGGQSNG